MGQTRIGAVFDGGNFMGNWNVVRAALLPSARFVWCVAAGLALSCAAAHPAEPVQLITPAEAALPPGTAPSFEVRGSPTRLPNITVASPHPGGGAVYSPLDFKLTFRAFGGAKIDPDSVVVTYVKKPNIDITARIKPFITADGVEVAQAEVPPGQHQFWIEVKDTDGRTAGREVDFQVLK
jgi:hypothetical protein